ncbi:MAG: ankyrin repeat domain-containing protein [Vicinamibacterales bacterium]
MRFVLSALIVGSLSFGIVHAQSVAPQAPAAHVDYDKDVKPLLSQNCYSCHGPDVQQSGLRLDLRQNALRGGDYGPVIVPGKSHESKIIRRLVDGDGGMQMPPSGALLPEEIATLRAWIDQGAEFRNDVADDAPPKPVDPLLAAMITAVRSGSRAAILPLVTANPTLLNAKDAGGSTLLHHAAAFGTVDAMTFLLDAGADVNAKNRRGSSPLHWAIRDPAKVRLLLARGAAINARQVEGRTPLYQAASLGDGIDIMRLLLSNGADPNIALANGRTPLMAAADHGDVEALTLLLGAKVPVDVRNGAGETALILAAGDGNPRAVQLLLDRGADPRARTKRSETALGNAGTSGNEETVHLLIDHGADVNVRNIRGYSPLMLAASSDVIPAGVVKLLLAKDADVTFTADYDESARDLAAKRGDTDVMRLLGGVATSAVLPVASHEASVPLRPTAAAVEQAITMAEKASYNFIRVGGCNSCHSQDLASVASGFARSRGVNAAPIPQLPQSMMPSPERLLDLSFVGAPSLGWELLDFGMNGVPKNAYTDAAVEAIKAMQTREGNWSANESRRPPMNAGDFNAAAVAIYAIRHYTPVGNEASSEQAVQRAVKWIEEATPATTQDYAFRALALEWANPASDSSSKSARTLLGMQRPDGGWSQMAGLASDAYATGQALFALYTAGKLSVTDPAYRKGIDYLRRTQAADGTWQVKSRSIWLQPYFESGFPYGRDQFISTAGTAWAAMALATTAQPATSSQR